MAGEQKSFATKYKVSNPIAEVKCYDLHKSYVTKTETPEF